MDQLWGTVVGGGIAAVTAAGTQYLIYCLTERRERRVAVWKKDVDRLFALEELAGELNELAGGYRSVADDMEELNRLRRQLELSAGRLGRHPAVRQAGRDLHNVVNRLIDAKRQHQDGRTLRDELEGTYSRLLEACDHALAGRRG